MVLKLCPSLLVVGWLGLGGETNWYGIWRGDDEGEGEGEGGFEPGTTKGKGKGKERRDSFEVRPLDDEDLLRLEERVKVCMFPF